METKSDNENAERSALEMSFATFCKQHNLHCLSINFSTSDDSAWFTTYAHAADLLGSGTADDLAGSLTAAINNLNARRGLALADEALPELAA